MKLSNAAVFVIPFLALVGCHGITGINVSSTLSLPQKRQLDRAIRSSLGTSPIGLSVEANPRGDTSLRIDLQREPDEWGSASPLESLIISYTGLSPQGELGFHLVYWGSTYENYARTGSVNGDAEATLATAVIDQAKCQVIQYALRVNDKNSPIQFVQLGRDGYAEIDEGNPVSGTAATTNGRKVGPRITFVTAESTKLFAAINAQVKKLGYCK